VQPEEVTAKTRMAFTTRSFLLRLAVAAIAIFFFPIICRTGGPKSVAGTTYFDPTRGFPH
jgi:hypothetical protein